MSLFGSGPYFPEFGLDTAEYGEIIRISPYSAECGKIRTRINLNTDTLHVVSDIGNRLNFLFWFSTWEWNNKWLEIYARKTFSYLILNMVYLVLHPLIFLPNSLSGSLALIKFFHHCSVQPFFDQITWANRFNLLSTF